MQHDLKGDLVNPVMLRSDWSWGGWALKVLVLDQGLVNCLDPEPCCSNWDMHVWKEGEGPSLEPTPLIPVLSIVNRDSKGMDATQRGVTIPHSGRAAAGSGHQQSKHTAFLKSLC